MLCLVKQPDCKIFEVLVDSKDTGQSCLDQVCKMLGIISVDYFGLQYRRDNNELLWLNMRNRLSRQMRGPPPFRLALRVKFFVPPQYILQDSTRHQFYLNVKDHILEGLVTVDEEQALRFASLMAQAELGNFDPGSLINYASLVSDRWRDGTGITCQVAQRHMALHGTKPGAAKYQLLKEAAALEEELGVETYPVKSSSGAPLWLRVGPCGLTVLDQHNTIQHSIPYGSILTTTKEVRCFLLEYIGNDGCKPVSVIFKQDSQTACAIYRAVIENHVFYSCETVRDAVTSQFIRDLKGIVASLFNENTPLGKAYVFDVRRTCREVYDYTRRTLYQMEAAVILQNPECQEGARDDAVAMQCESFCCKAQRKSLKQQLSALQDSILCRVCMDDEISAAFFPCSHAVCCHNCAILCQQCPVCRADIRTTQRIYLPLKSCDKL